MKKSWVLTSNKRLCQYVATFSVMLITISSGMHFGWTSPYMSLLLSSNSPIPLTEGEASWVSVIYLLGGPPGAVIAAAVLNVFGRKPILITSSLMFLVSWLMLTFARSYAELLIMRFIAGASDGLIFGSTPIYLVEIADKKIRGFLVGFISIALMFGVLLMNVIGTYLSVRDSSLISMMFPMASLLISLWLPESPNYLLMKGETEKARKCLVKLRPLIEVEDELKDIAKSVEEDAKVKFLNLFSTKMYRKSLMINVGMLTGQQLSGMVAIIFYSQTVFDEAIDTISPLMAVVIVQSVQMVSASVSSVLTDKVGRKPLLITSITIAALALLVEGTYFYLLSEKYFNSSQIEWLPISGLVVFVVAYSVGLQTIPMCISGEIFPVNLRSHAAAFADVYYYLLAFVVSEFFTITMNVYGLYSSLECYPMDHDVLGIVHIFCHTKFRNISLGIRHSATQDYMDVEATFKNLNFNVVVHKDLKYSDILQKLTDISSMDYSNIGCVVIFVLSHRKGGKVYARDIDYYPDVYWKMLDKNSSLLFKPKYSSLECYPMDHDVLGIVHIFCHTKFRNISLGIRHSATQDYMDVEATFKNLNFNVVVHKDLKYSDILQKLTDISSMDYSNIGCVVIFVLSHRKGGKVYARDIDYYPDVYWKMLDKNSSLLFKPKLIFVQATRGDQVTDEDFPDLSKPLLTFPIPDTPDVLLTYSCYDEFFSWHVRRTGSWFIFNLCNEIKKSAHNTDVLTLLTNLNKVLKKGRAVKKFEEPIGTILSTLTKRLYFKSNVN
ncbi:hypothetical protein FQR65_LT12201 [Abscondita terminalis]|nr:hypothetical protein FQR65_LT12201 [Abscondita terminalis]